ncbi:MAG: GNAT family N-acetyltransferase [Bacteroidales bacterium]|nr:GNAT family N-acetyltransferase [Bacteroidales bacterium]
MEPTIRLAGENDKDNILHLLNNVFMNQQRSDVLRGDQYWKWKFTMSPFGKSVLTVAESDNEIIGVDNLWPWEFNVRGEVYKAYQPCDSVVHPGARGKSLFKNMRLHGLEVIRKDNPSFLFNFPNNQSINANLSLGWFSMGKIPWMVRLIRPFNVINGMFKTNKTESILLDDVYNINISLLESIDKDNLNYSSYIKPHRKKGYFDWRYLQHPRRHYGMIYLEKGKYASSAIFTVNRRNSYKEMFIVELIGCPKITYDLLKTAIEIAKKMDISILTLTHNSSFNMSKLWQLGFIKQKAKNMVVLPLNLNFETILKSFANWSMFACLHDSI